jgi:hypothetical protein
MLGPAQLGLAVMAVVVTTPDSGDPRSQDPDLRAAITAAIDSPEQRNGGPEYPKSELAQFIARAADEVETRRALNNEEEVRREKWKVEASLDAALAAAADQANKIVQDALLLTVAKPERDLSDKALEGIVRGVLQSIVVNRKTVDPKRPFNGKALVTAAMAELRSRGITKSRGGALRPFVQNIADAEFNAGFRKVMD